MTRCRPRSRTPTPRSRSRARRCSGQARRRPTQDLFSAALDDRVHEPYRESALVRELREAGHSATLSGSGPAAIVWVEDAARPPPELRERYPDHRVLPLAVSPQGAHA